MQQFNQSKQHINQVKTEFKHTQYKHTNHKLLPLFVLTNRLKEGIKKQH